MKHKKQNPDKKRFWLGMAGCALVGFTAYAVSYFSSSHIFSNEYNAHKNYSVENYDVINTNTTMNLWANQHNHINADLIIRNNGSLPVLLRIKYSNAYLDVPSGQWFFYDRTNYSCHNCLKVMRAFFIGEVQEEDRFCSMAVQLQRLIQLLTNMTDIIIITKS